MASRSDPISGAPPDRGQWQTRMGFVLAAAGSAIGLGNIWKFPYITGEYGGGLFVLIYLVCIALVGVPVMVSELIIGRAAQKSPVSAYEELSGGKFIWSVVGWMGVAAGFILLSYYSVVAGWSIKYTLWAFGDSFTGKQGNDIIAMFGGLASDTTESVGWHGLFMGITVLVVLGGIRRGIELCVRVAMPILLLLMCGMMIYAAFSVPEFGMAVRFVFEPHADKLTMAGVLEALGHSFFTLSVGVGGLITYGSYLRKQDDIFTSAAAISSLDTLVALVACLVMFPFLFAAELSPSQGPGLVFIAMPMAFSQLDGGFGLGVVFFVLLLFAALTSAISLMEVVVSTLIDKFRIKRTPATLITGGSIFGYGVLSAKSDLIIHGRTFQAWMDFFVSNVFLPLGGMAIAIFAGWVMPRAISFDEFNRRVERNLLYAGWLFLVRFLAPVGISIIFVYGIYNAFWG